MSSKGFAKEELQDCLFGDTDSLSKVEDNIVDTSRWSIHSELIFKDLTTGKFYRTMYSRGATESQDESPFEFDDDVIKCQEVKPVEVIKTEWVKADG